jgi:hypothetical protein
MRDQEPLGLHPIASEILACVVESPGGLDLAEGAPARLTESLLALSGEDDFDRAISAFAQIAAQLDARGAPSSAQILLEIALFAVPLGLEQRHAAGKRAREVLAASAEKFRSFSGASASGPSASPVDTKSSLRERASQRQAFHTKVRI